MILKRLFAKGEIVGVIYGMIEKNLQKLLCYF